MGAYLHGGGTQGGLRARLHALPAAVRAAQRSSPGTLSGGEQQMVAMGRALMSRPKLLLMDEPSMGLAPILVERSFEIIKQVHEAGVAILVVEQNANMSLSIADRGYVLSTGRIVLEGTARRPARRTRTCGRPTLAVERRRARRLELPAPLPDLRAAGLRQLVLAGRALGRGARRLRAVPRATGTRTARRGSTGSSAGGRARGVRRARQRRAGRDRGHDVALRGRQRARERAPLRRARRKVVVTDWEFPTIGQIWHAQESRGARVVHVPADGGRRRSRSSTSTQAIDERDGARRRSRTSASATARCSTSPAIARARARARRARPARRLPGDRLAAGRRRGARRRLPRGRRAQVPARVGRARRSSTAGATSSSGCWPTQTGWFADEDIFAMDIRDYSPAHDRARASSRARRRCRRSTRASPGSS